MPFHFFQVSWKEETNEATADEQKLDPYAQLLASINARKFN